MHQGSYKSDDYLTTISMISFCFMAGIGIWEKSVNKPVVPCHMAGNYFIIVETDKYERGWWRHG